MTLSLLQVQSFNYFAITYTFNTLTHFVKKICFVYLTEKAFFFLNHDIQGERDIKIMLSLYFESCIMKMLVQI